MDIIKVPFDNTIIPCIKDGDTFYVFIKPICEYLGIDFESQGTRIKNDPILSRVSGVYPVHDASGRLQNSVSLPTHHVHGWLFSINTHRITSDDARERLLLFKEKCYQVLFEYFSGADRAVSHNTRRIYALKHERFQAGQKEMFWKKKGRELDREIAKLEADSFLQLDLPLVFEPSDDIKKLGSESTLMVYPQGD